MACDLRSYQKRMLPHNRTPTVVGLRLVSLGPSPCGYATSHLYFFTLYSGTAGSRMGTVWQ